MPKTLFEFSEMMVNCLHQEGFTNTIKKTQFKPLLAELLRATRLFSANDFETKAREIDNYHEVKAEYMKTRIGELLGWKKQEINDLEREQVWQIPLGKEVRLFGVLKKVKCWGATNIFQVLVLDPNHKVYHASSKEDFPVFDNSVCLFVKEDECVEVSQQKKLLRKKK